MTGAAPDPAAKGPEAPANTRRLIWRYLRFIVASRLIGLVLERDDPGHGGMGGLDSKAGDAACRAPSQPRSGQRASLGLA